MADNKDTQIAEQTYGELDAILKKEKENTPVKDEELNSIMAKLQELSKSQSDFDAGKLEEIIEFATKHSNLNGASEVIQKATEQKNRTANTPADNTKADKNEKTDDKPEKPAQEAEKSSSDDKLYNPDMPVMSQASYNVYKRHQELKNKENLTAEEQKDLDSIEKQVDSILACIEREVIDSDNAVAINDYIGISNNSTIANEETKKRNDELQSLIDPHLQKYDEENGIVNIELEELIRRQKELKAIAEQDNKLAQNIAGQLNFGNDVPPQMMQEITNTIIASSIQDASLKDMSINAENLEKVAGDKTAEFKALVNAEYLKRQATEEFAKKNNLSEEKLNELAKTPEDDAKLSDEDKKLKKQLAEYLQQQIEKFPNFNGPYDNPKHLAQAVDCANAVMINRATLKNSRIARATKAPCVSSTVDKVRNSFATKHPKLYNAVSSASVLGKGYLGKMAISAGIGFAFGPVGMAAYSAVTTGKAIFKSYKNYKQKNENSSFLGYLKHLTKRENRAEALTLVGQVAATAIAGYFTMGTGVENMNFGFIGNKLAGNATHATAAVAQSVGQISSGIGWLDTGVNSVLKSPRRVAAMVSTVTIGTAKGLSAMLNKRHARKELASIMQNYMPADYKQADGSVISSKDLIKQLETIKDKDVFMGTLAQIAPNMPPEAKEAAFKQVEMIQNSSAKKAFVATAAGAAIGILAANEAENHTIMNMFKGNEGNDVDGITAESQPTPNKPDTPQVEVEPNLSHQAEELWNGDKAAAQRFESFGIDAKNANEMLREMGVIKEGDNHFYRQSELAKLVNEASLDDKQKIAIQEWANDRDARVHNLKVWQAAHPTHTPSGNGNLGGNNNLGGGNLGGSNLGGANLGDANLGDANLGNGNGGFSIELPQNDGENIPTKLYHVQGRIDDLKVRRGEYSINAANPLAAAEQFFEDKGDVNKSSTINVYDQEGDRVAKIKQHIGNTKTTLKIKEYDEETGKKVSYAKTKFYDDGHMESYEKRDIDGDGKKDIIRTTTAKDGSMVTYTKYGNGNSTLEVDGADGQTLKYDKNEMLTQNPKLSESNVSKQMSTSYDIYKKMYKSNGK